MVKTIIPLIVNILIKLLVNMVANIDSRYAGKQIDVDAIMA